MRVRRADLQQVHVREGHATVLRGGQSIVLSDVATTILMAVSPTSSTSLEEITATVVAKLGPPSPPLEAEELVRGLVLELVGSELLTQDETPGPESPTNSSDAALCDALRHVVSGELQGWMPPSHVTGPELLAAAQRHRVTSTLATAYGRLALPHATEAKLVTIAWQEAGAVRYLEHDLTEATEALTRAEVRALALEGLVLAVQAHGHVTARGTDQHDLLVAPEDLERTLEVLTSLGWMPGTGFPRPAGPAGPWRDFVRDFSEIPLTRHKSAIGLHWRLATSDDATQELDDLWSRRTSVTIGKTAVPTLSPYDALARAASKAGPGSSSRLRDLLDVWLLVDQPGTWQDDVRALSPQQLLTIGRAVRAFGMPAQAPDVVHEALSLVDDSTETGEQF